MRDFNEEEPAGKEKTEKDPKHGIVREKK